MRRAAKYSRGCGSKVRTQLGRPDARAAPTRAEIGTRPDLHPVRQVIPRDYLLDATDWQRAPDAFRPGKADRFFGYGYQFWLYPGQPRRFVMLGIYGQSLFVDPANRLVVVQTGANATAEAGQTTLARERLDFWRGLIRYYEAK